MGTGERSTTGRRGPRQAAGAAVVWSFRVERDRAAIGRLSDSLEQELSDALPQAVLRALQVALDELLTNVVMHAQQAAGPIDVALTRGPDALDAQISYLADAFDPTAWTPVGLDAGVATARIGGRGILLVRALMDDFRYRYDDGCNVVMLSKRC
jgi:anti-sigma regulatory factor (Ser/Thr protein kinase)